MLQRSWLWEAFGGSLQKGWSLSPAPAKLQSRSVQAWVPPGRQLHRSHPHRDQQDPQTRGPMLPGRTVLRRAAGAGRAAHTVTPTLPAQTRARRQSHRDREVLLGSGGCWPSGQEHKPVRSISSDGWLAPVEKEIRLWLKAPGDGVQPPCAQVRGTQAPCCQLQLLTRGMEERAEYPPRRRGDVSLL